MAKSESKNERRARLVWQRLTECYGARLLETYGTDIPKPWLDAIEKLSDESIAQALIRVRAESPVHPPTLGQFERAGIITSKAPRPGEPTIQEQLCEYVARQLSRQLITVEARMAFSRPWTYRYREWRDDTRPKGFERCAECTAVEVDMSSGVVSRFTVEQMFGDREGHAEVMRYFNARGGKPLGALELDLTR